MKERLMQRYIRELLAKLDAEHSHQAPCETCTWLEKQPEWQAMKAERETDG
jgi:hypothetical protein